MPAGIHIPRCGGITQACVFDEPEAFALVTGDEVVSPLQSVERQFGSAYCNSHPLDFTKKKGGQVAAELVTFMQAVAQWFGDEGVRKMLRTKGPPGG